MKHNLSIFVAAVMLAVLPVGLSGAEAQENWTKQCAKCHGPDGMGKTPSGKMLKVKDLSDPTVKAELTDDAIRTSITAGVKNAAGKLVMPSFEEKIPANEVADLVAFVRGLARSG